MVNIPSMIYLNQTLEIAISALNFGPEICCECPVGISLDNSSDECIGAEISLFIDGELVDIYQTKPLGRVNGEEVRIFYWQPIEPGLYYIEAVIDPDNIIDEFNELDNRVSAEVTVSVEEEVEIIEAEEEEEDSLINQPLIWIPLGVLDRCRSWNICLQSIREMVEIISMIMIQVHLQVPRFQVSNLVLDMIQ